jgi:hypothetical protein
VLVSVVEPLVLASLLEPPLESLPATRQNPSSHVAAASQQLDASRHQRPGSSATTHSVLHAYGPAPTVEPPALGAAQNDAAGHGTSALHASKGAPVELSSLVIDVEPVSGSTPVVSGGGGGLRTGPEAASSLQASPPTHSSNTKALRIT